MTNRHDWKDAVTFAIFRHHANALSHGITRRADFDFFAVKKDLTCISTRPHTKQA